jgi:hypothetical protein
MSAAPITLSDLEYAGFDIQGVAEALHAFAVSERAKGMEMALELLGDATNRALTVLIDYVEQETEAASRRLAEPKN